jgi:hypothetical protein
MYFILLIQASILEAVIARLSATALFAPDSFSVSYTYKVVFISVLTCLFLNDSSAILMSVVG